VRVMLSSSDGVVPLSQTQRDLPTTANVAARNFKDLACWLIVQIGPISLNVTTPFTVTNIATSTYVDAL
jgi:hypothetical protein